MEGGTTKKKRNNVKRRILSILMVSLLMIQHSSIVLATEVKSEVPESIPEVKEVYFIDVSENIKAELHYNDQVYVQEMKLSKEDFTKENVTLSVMENEQENELIIDFNNIELNDEKIRLYGNYTTGEKDNPVIYKLKLRKNVTFSLGDKNETISMVFEQKFDYWSEDNNCSDLLDDKGNQNKLWLEGNVIEDSGFAILFPVSKNNLAEETTDEPAKEEGNQEEVSKEEPQTEGELPEEEPESVEEVTEEPRKEEPESVEEVTEEPRKEEPESVEEVAEEPRKEEPESVEEVTEEPRKEEPKPVEEVTEELPKEEPRQDETPIEEPKSVAEPVEEPEEEAPRVGSLTIKKIVVGENQWDETFEILVTGENTEYLYKEKLKNGEAFTLENIPVGIYKIEEVKAENEKHLYDMVILVDNQKVETEKFCMIEITENTNPVVSLKSTVKTISWDVHNTKTEVLLTGRRIKEKEFTFEIMDDTGKIITTGTVDAANKNEKATIHWMDATCIYNTIGTYSYTVRQVIPSVKAGGVTYDSNSFLITIKVGIENDTLKIEEIYTQEILFKNLYDVKDAPFAVSGIVTLNAGNRKIREKEFVFTLIETDEKGVPLSGAQTIEMVNDNNGIFGTTLIYKLKNVGTHYYLVTQKVLGEKGMKYGINKYLLKVTVTDNEDGTLKVSPEKYEKLSFTNIYEAEKKFSIQTKVELKGRKLQEKEFTFKLKPISADTPIPEKVTAVNCIDGNITFDSITYDENDIGKTYEYQIYQLKGDDKEITYDKSTYQISVTIKDEGNAELTITQTEEPIFKNVYGEVAVKTGDYTPIEWYAGAMIAAMLALIALEMKKRNKRI